MSERPEDPKRLPYEVGRAIRAHPVCQVGPNGPMRWLALGWADLIRCPLPGLLHGLAMATFGLALVLLVRDRFWLLAGAFSGFLLVAPVVATGLYAVSRELEQGRRATLGTALAAWHPRPPQGRRLVLFGLLLALAGTGWVLTSAALITRFASAPVSTPADFVRVVLLAGDGNSVGLFEAWLILGAALAAPIFASSVVAIPLLMDRDIGVRPAVLVSVRAALVNPLPMAMWATLIMVFTLLGMATAMLGLVVAVPWLAHASWHAYRELVGPEQPAGRG
jgi:uncharacterized membrane protein